MEPSRSENVAHLKTLWEQYTNEGTEDNLNKMMRCIERINSDFTTENAHIFQNIHVTLVDRKAPPMYVERVKDLFNICTPEGPIQDLPGELKLLLTSCVYSIKDLSSLMLVRKEWKEISEKEIIRRIELCQEQLTAEDLIGTLMMCGSKIRHLDLYRLLKNQPPITQEQLKQILEQCPFLQTVVLGDLDRQSFWLSWAITPPTILLEHFSRPPASQSLHAFALIAPSLGWRGNYGLDVSLSRELKKLCPNLMQFSVDCVLTPESGEPIPSSLEPWLKKGKSIFRFKELFKKLTESFKPNFSTAHWKFLYLVPPDWFLNLKEARQKTLLNFAEPLSKLTQDEMDAFAAMSEVEQDLKLTQLSP